MSTPTYAYYYVTLRHIELVQISPGLALANNKQHSLLRESSFNQKA